MSYSHSVTTFAGTGSVIDAFPYSYGMFEYIRVSVCGCVVPWQAPSQDLSRTVFPDLNNPYLYTLSVEAEAVALAKG